MPYSLPASWALPTIFGYGAYSLYIPMQFLRRNGPGGDGCGATDIGGVADAGEYAYDRVMQNEKRLKTIGPQALGGAA